MVKFGCSSNICLEEVYFRSIGKNSINCNDDVIFLISLDFFAGFKRKCFRAKMAIAVTANFVNGNTTAESRVPEISGLAYIYHQDFFKDLKTSVGIDLENIVYYKGDTHYFVMTPKKSCLIAKGVLKKVVRSNIFSEDFSSNHVIENQIPFFPLFLRLPGT
jgi:hypothetical protein